MSAVLQTNAKLGQSIFYKTLAVALRPFLTGDTNLFHSRRAFFVSVPFTDGVPDGDQIKQEVTNEQLFRISDVMQDPNTPTFGYNRAGSYFDRQYEYLLNLQDDTDTKADQARANLSNCLNAVKTAYASDVARYQALLPSNPGLNFVDWMTKFGFDYNAASEDLKLAQQTLARSQSQPMRDVKARIDSMLAARSPVNYVLGSNMPAQLSDYTVVGGSSPLNIPSSPTTISVPNISQFANLGIGFSGMVSSAPVGVVLPPSTLPPIQPQPAGSFLYRPLHYLSDYEDTVRSWVDNFQNGGQISTTVEVPVSQALNETWQTFGFTNFDENVPEILSPGGVFSSKMDPHLAFVSQVSGQNPLAVLAADTQLTFRASGIYAFDIFRGLWNIDNIRTLLPGLLPTAASSVANPFLKTTRLLLGYGIDISLSCQTSALRSLGLSSNPETELDVSVVGSFLEALNTPAIRSKSLMFGQDQSSSTTSPIKNPTPFTDLSNKDVTSDRTTIWKMSSSDNGTPVLLAILAEWT